MSETKLTLEAAVLDVIQTYWEYGGDQYRPQILRMGDSAYHQLFQSQMNYTKSPIFTSSPNTFVWYTDFGTINVRKCFTFAEPWMWELGFEHTL